MSDLNPKYKAKLIHDELGGFDAIERDRFYGSEGFFHYTCKHLTAKLIVDAGREVCIEQDIGDGTVDVLDLGGSVGDSVEHARAIELETSYSKATAREKYERYVEQSDLVEDVHVVPIGEAPRDLDDLKEYLASEIPCV